MHLIFNRVTFTYEGAPEALFEDISAHFPTGWTGIVGANGAGKSTLLRLASGELSPTNGSIQRSDGLVVTCDQRTDSPPELLGAFLSACDGDARRLAGQMGIESDWLFRWETLSHGERKRAQIAVALWQRPDILLVDEPTNHIDAAARELLAEALSTFKGVGLLVSHDRTLLDDLCDQCLFVEPPTVTMRPGGYTEAAAQARMETESTAERRRVAKAQFERIHDEYTRRKQEASTADKRRSKRKLARGDSDGRSKLDGVRVSGADGKAGRLANQLNGRVKRAEETLDAIQVKKEYSMSFWLPGSRSKQRYLFTIPAGELPLGEERRLSYPELAMSADDRIAITGPNGAGKSTLVQHILTVLTLPPERVIYLPQEIDEEASRTIMAEVNTLSPEALGHVMTVVSSLGSRPNRLVGSTESSPGEIRKVLLGLGVVKSPYLIVMDEPTNHLDLPAIERLEESLSECPCGLLLISHDTRFISRLARKRWEIGMEGGDSKLRVVDAIG